MGTDSPPRLQIIDWPKHFENSKSRERDACHFVCVPNKQDGMGLLRILARPDGAGIYGIWCLMVGVCSRQRRPRDGWLTDTGLPGGCPLSAQDLALRWHRSVEEIEVAIEVLSGPNVGWIRKIDAVGTAVPAECPDGAREVPAKCLGMEGKEGNRKKEQRLLQEPGTPEVDVVVVDPVGDALVDAFDSLEKRDHGDATPTGYAHLVPLDLRPLLQDWMGRGYLGGTQLEFLGERIERHGVETVRRALQQHIAQGTAPGKWTYLDAILASGAKDVDRAKRESDDVVQHLKKLGTKLRPMPKGAVV